MEDQFLERNRSARASALVEHLYSDVLAGAQSTRSALSAFGAFVRLNWPRPAWKRAAAHLSKGIRVAAERISSLPSQVTQSEMVSYWKDLVQGLPEYAALVRARKFREIENVLTTLATQNELFRVHRERLAEIQRALKELQDERGGA